MDTLALLCNLHAEGPATLQRLRRAGCESLSALRRLDALTLAEHLEWNERRAERFLREAVLLGERVEQAEDESSELAEPEFELESTLVEELDGDGEEAEAEEPEDESDSAQGQTEEQGVGYAPPAERVAAVLGAWRELDSVSPPDEPGAFVIPRPAPVADGRLDALSLAGLSRPLVERLAELGIGTLQELVGASGLELARSIPLGFTRLKHLQFLGARELERLAAGLPAPATAERIEAFEPFVPPPAEPFETAGPFA
jgi:hypothetical protein